MKQYYLFLFLGSLILTSNSNATIACGNIKFDRSIIQPPIYHFKTVMTCELIDENINIKNLKEAYLSDITKKGSQFKVHQQKNYTNSKGTSGYSLDVTQSYNTPNGAMSVRAKIIITDDGSNNFYYEMHSTSIKAEGDAKLEKSMLNTTTLEKLSNKSKATVTKEINVEKPWYAPESIFLDKVESSLKESTKEAALANARKIAGENVDPLRK